MSVAPLLVAASEGEALGGGSILLLLVLVMVGLLAFGAGRDHS